MVNMRVNSKQIMTWIIKHAFSREEGKSQTNEEFLEMIASGRFGEIPKLERHKLLSTIAENPEDSALLNDLCRLRQVQQSVLRTSTTYRIMTLAWGMAACLMIGLFVSRVIDPPYRGIGIQTVAPYGTEAEPDYWSQLDKQRLSMQSKWHSYRDFALVASTTACLSLSAAITFLILKNQKKEKTDHR